MYHGEVRTPESQRVHAQALGCYRGTTEDTHPSSALVDGEGRAKRATAEENEESALVGLKMSAFSSAVGFHTNATEGPHTPPTVSRHSWLQLHMHDDGPFPSGLHAHAGETFMVPSPTSFAPLEGTSEFYSVRSVSCPSANRSVAPARYSLECNVVGGGRGSSAGRHTTLLGSVGLNGSGLQDTPASRVSAAAPTAAALAARPTILMHTSISPVHQGERCRNATNTISCRDGDPRWGNAAVGGRAAPYPHITEQHPLHSQGCVDVAVPHLTRFSGASSGNGCSPGCSERMGRPTMLRCPDFDLGVYHRWDEKDDDEPWMGGVTQVWRSSAELNEPPAVLPQPPTKAPPSPEVTCRPLSVGGVNFATDVRGQPTRATPLLGESHVNEENAGAVDVPGQHNSLTSAAQSASLTCLEDAPRKSYVRSAMTSPTRVGSEGIRDEAPARDESAAWDARGGAACAPSKVSVVAPLPWPSQPNPNTGAAAVTTTTTTVATTSALPLNAMRAGQLCDQLFRDISAGVVRSMENGATSQGRPFAPHAQPADPSALAAATAADAVAAQLARLSLQASPTQKRLAFEEEEEDGLEDSRRSSDGVEGIGNLGSVAPAQNGLDARAGCSGTSYNAALTVANRWTNGGGRGGGGGGSLSGLQLLRSRKRCLAEMQASDVEASKPCLPANSPALAAGAANAACGQVDMASLVISSQEDPKRQKREEQRYQRQRHFPPGEGSGDDLIPAPVWAGAAPSMCSSVASFALQNGACSQGGSQLPQSLPLQGEDANWSELSSNSYVTPASQSCSIGMTGVLGYPPLSQRDGCSFGASGAVACASAPSSQVLSSLPTNVAQRYVQFKQ
jgi:hypothetical protein